MKKLLLILLCLPMIGLGQEKSFELGLLFGGSFNSLNGDLEFTENTLRPKGGFLAQYNFNNSFSIKSKLLYHIKGGKTTKGQNEFDQRSDLHYITLPLLAQWNFGKNKWVFFCNTGAYLGYLIKTSKSLEKLNKLDFGLMLGSGVSFQINEKIKVFLESSFDHGLTNTSGIESKAIILTQTINGAIGLTYNFPTKKKTFNGAGVLKCTDHEKEKKKSKWRLVLYKDGKKIGGKSKKGKSRLFKKKK